MCARVCVHASASGSRGEKKRRGCVQSETAGMAY